jgi:hypothetical protein
VRLVPDEGRRFMHARQVLRSSDPLGSNDIAQGAVQYRTGEDRSQFFEDMMVEPNGIEPMTSSMPWKRSPS